MRIRLGVCLAVLAALAFAPGGGAASEARTVLLGAFGDYERFDSMTGQRTRVGHVIMSWGQATGPRLDRMLAGMREIPMLGIGTNRGHPITPLAIARSEGDAFLVDLNRAVAAFPGERIYIRPFGEMNGHWNDYSAQAYYPGALFVDVVGNDLYNIRFKAEWAANEALYRAHPKKPYAIPEWGNWSIDDPGFVKRMAEFVRTHPRVELVAYFNSRAGSPWDLATKPKSRQAYRQHITPLGR